MFEAGTNLSNDLIVFLFHPQTIIVHDDVGHSGDFGTDCRVINAYKNGFK